LVGEGQAKRISPQPDFDFYDSTINDKSRISTPRQFVKMPVCVSRTILFTIFWNQWFLEEALEERDGRLNMR